MEADTGGVYATFRARGPHKRGIGPYFKIKAGAAYSDVTVGDESEDDTIASAGVALGINMATVQFEWEYTQVTDDAEMLSLSIRF